MKNLIIGGAGFIGFHLAKKLAEINDEVVIVDDFSRGVVDDELKSLLKKENVRLIQINCLDRTKIMQLDDDYDYIYMLAAIIGVKHVLEHPYEVLRQNVELLLNITDLARKQKSLKRLLFTSTSEVYAGTLKYFDLKIPTPESEPLAITPMDSPRTSYMLSKVYGEALLMNDSLSFTIVRPHNIYGPRMGMSHVIPEQLKKVYFSNNGDIVTVPSINHKRTFCYIDDAIEMIYELVNNDGTDGGVFNIGNENPEIEIGELVDIISRVVKKNIIIKAGDETEGSPKRRCPSMKKTFDNIVFRPRVSIEMGVKKTFTWYKENVFSGGESAI